MFWESSGRLEQKRYRLVVTNYSGLHSFENCTELSLDFVLILEWNKLSDLKTFGGQTFV